MVTCILFGVWFAYLSCLAQMYFGMEKWRSLHTFGVMNIDFWILEATSRLIISIWLNFISKDHNFIKKDCQYSLCWFVMINPNLRYITINSHFIWWWWLANTRIILNLHKHYESTKCNKCKVNKFVQEAWKVLAT